MKFNFGKDFAGNKLYFFRSDLLLGLLLFFTSPIIRKLGQVPWWLLVGMVMGFVVYLKSWFWRWLVLILLIAANLYLNRLLSFNTPLSLSFDWEQSYFDYPGILESVDRYFEEGLWFFYKLRKLVYGSYLLLFPWLFSILKLLSASLWIRTFGFAGVFLMALGIRENIRLNLKMGDKVVWLVLVLMSSALRVIGDSTTYLMMTLPVIVYWWFLALKTKPKGVTMATIMGLFLVDICII